MIKTKNNFAHLPATKLATAMLAVCMGTISVTAHAQGQVPVQTPTNAANAEASKLPILGIVAAGFAANAFMNWVTNRNNAAPVPATLPQSSAAASTIPVVAGPSGTTAGTQTLFHASRDYNSTPIILGQPDVPLRPAANADQRTQWNNNYQGVYVSYVVFNAQNKMIGLRPLSAPLRPGERFKIRVLSSFDAVVAIDQLRANQALANSGKAFVPPLLVGRLYPQSAAQLVQINAGVPAYLPLGANETFSADTPVNPELVMLNVRHKDAPNAGSLNSQPFYRQDTPDGTSYLQLSNPSSYPAISQIIALQRM